MVIFRFEGDKIVEIKEFMDSAYVLSVQEKIGPKVRLALSAGAFAVWGLIGDFRSTADSLGGFVLNILLCSVMLHASRSTRNMAYRFLSL